MRIQGSKYLEVSESCRGCSNTCCLTLLMVALEDRIQASLEVVVVLDVLDAVCICIDFR